MNENQASQPSPRPTEGPGLSEPAAPRATFIVPEESLVEFVTSGIPNGFHLVALRLDDPVGGRVFYRAELVEQPYRGGDVAVDPPTLARLLAPWGPRGDGRVLVPPPFNGEMRGPIDPRECKRAAAAFDMTCEEVEDRARQVLAAFEDTSGVAVAELLADDPPAADDGPSCIVQENGRLVRKRIVPCEDPTAAAGDAGPDPDPPGETWRDRPGFL